MSAATPRVSVIVVAPSFNDFGRRCIAGLRRLRGDLEIIFVPDVAAEVGPDVLVVPSGPGLTTGRKRQLGLDRARGEFIALIDDDAYPHQSWLAMALGVLDADRSIAAVAGPALTPPDEGELEFLSGRVYASPLVSGPAAWRYGRFISEREVDDAPSCNLVIRRDLAQAVGFDSEENWGEDTVFSEALRQSGGRIHYDPGVIVYHSRRPLWVPHLRQLYRWARHRSVHARTVGGNSRRPVYFAPSALLLFLLAGPFTRGRARRLWRFGAVLYAVAVTIAGGDPRPSRWARTSGGIVATHCVYGAGFLVGLLGADPVRR